MSTRAQKLLIASVTLLLTALYVPSLNVPSWTGRFAILPALAVAGVVLVVVRVRRERNIPFLLATGFLTWAFVSALASPHDTLALTGLYGSGTGLLFGAALVGAWGLGRRVDGDGRRWLEFALYAGLALNVLVAVLEQSVDLSFVRLGLVDRRSQGLMGNPVHLGSLGAGLAALLLWSEKSLLRVLLAVGAGVSVQLSGSRVALGVVVCAAVAAALWRRREVAIPAIAVAVGLVVALGISALGEGLATTERVGGGEAASGLRPRVDYWKVGGSAVALRPLLGSGPGTFGPATSPHRTPDVTVSVGPDHLFVDAHNLIVELAVTVGVPGALLFGAWLVTAARQAGGPLLVMAFAILGTQLLQPLSLATTPLAFLALGAAAGDRMTTSWTRPRLTGAVAVLIAPVMAVFAGSVVAGDYFLRQADLDFEIADARRANQLLPWWAISAQQRTEVHAFRAISRAEAAEWEHALRWSREGTRREPWNPQLWSRHGELLLVRESAREAADAFRAALARNPESFVAVRGLAVAESALGNDEAAATLARRALRRAQTEAQRDSLRELIRASD